jgi:O-acetyl-ADP-ribose deacetylase (regulator of RNase III)
MHAPFIMKIKPIHVGLAVATILTLMLWTSARLRKAALIESLAVPAATNTAPAQRAVPADPRQAALESTPEARAYRSRLAFEQQARAFLRDAPKLDEDARIQRARKLSSEIDRREQARELSAGDAVVLRIGLIQAAVVDDSERIRQSQAIVDRYRKQTTARQAAFQEQQRRDVQFQTYKTREAQIVSEVLAMTSYPNGMSRDDYLRVRLQEARETIYSAQNPPPTP